VTISPRLAVVAALLLIYSAPAVDAQSLGTFRWQLNPYCNVVSLAVTQVGSIFRLEGTDDQCSASTRAAASGLAFQNPDGTIGLGFTIISSPGGAPVTVDATITLATVSGTWRDSNGSSGAFTLTPGAPTAGSPRPATGRLVQFRVEGGSGQAMPPGERVDLTAWTTVQFNDGGGTYTPATGAYTVPISGLYVVSATASTSNVSAPGANTYRFLSIEVNGEVVQQTSDEASDTFQQLHIVGIRKLAAGDIVNLSMIHNLGAGLTALSNTPPDAHFAVIRLR
jgi:hypothetical protein